MSDWRPHGECVTQGADPEMFAPAERPRVRYVPPGIRTAYDLYCSVCPVARECGELADQTQTVGLFGGKYREISCGEYRTIDLTTDESTVEPLTQYITVKGDRHTGGEAPDPRLIPTETVMRILGQRTPQSTVNYLARRGIQPVRRSGGKSPNLYDPDEVIAVRPGIRARKKERTDGAA